MLEVVNPSDIKHAYRFSENLKNNICDVINKGYNSQIFESTDKNNNSVSILRKYDEDDDFEDKEVHIGDYIIFDKDETTVLDVLTEDAFTKKYADISI